MNKRLRLLVWAVIGAVCLCLTGCSGKETNTTPSLSAPGPKADDVEEEEREKTTEPIEETIAPFPETQPFVPYERAPGLKLLIATDIHYLAEELTDNSPVFIEMVEHGDGKVTNYIKEIMEAFTQEVIQEQPDLLILAGDLSFNGELKSHEELAGYLRTIEAQGIPVALIPGNHDINNKGASRYFKGERTPAEVTSPKQFYDIYHEFGYDEALSRDPESLSYVYPISDKVWALMLDSCQYKNGNLVGGMIDMETQDWIEEQLNIASDAGVMLLPVSHHNLLDESKIYVEDCTIEHDEWLRELLLGWGAPLYLSGHLHVQHYMNSDSEWETGGDTGIYEIVTSSLSTPPCQYGVLYFQDTGSFQYHTQILAMDSWAKASGQTDPNLLEFSKYREAFLEKVFYYQAYDYLSRVKQAEFSSRQMERMSEVYGKANCYYYWGRAIEIAQALQNSQEYELWWEYAGNSSYAEYLNYILDEALMDYNSLKVE